MSRKQLALGFLICTVLALTIAFMFLTIPWGKDHAGTGNRDPREPPDRSDVDVADFATDRPIFEIEGAPYQRPAPATRVEVIPEDHLQLVGAKNLDQRYDELVLRARAGDIAAARELGRFIAQLPIAFPGTREAHVRLELRRAMVQRGREALRRT